MQGYGMLQGSLAPDPQVWNFSMSGKWVQAEEPLHRIWESFTPIHIDLNRKMYGVPDTTPAAECAAHENRVRVGGAGLGLAFGIGLAELTGRPVGLIPTAFGGTSLEQWSPEQKHLGGGSLYGAMLERITRAGGNLRGVLWYQGESDCTPEWAPTYAKRLDELIAAIRRDTGRPELPFLAVQIGRSISGQLNEPAPEMDQVRDALGKLPTRAPHTAVTSAIDLGLIDTIHIDTPSLIRLGKRLARLAASFEPEKSPVPSAQIARVEKSRAVFGATILHLECDGVAVGWQCPHIIPGFSLHLPDGTPHPCVFAVNATVNAHKPHVIDILLNAELKEPVGLAYGLGRAPICLLADAEDMPLCAFLPMQVSP